MLQVQEKQAFGSVAARERSKERLYRELSRDRLEAHRKIVKHLGEQIKGNRQQRRAALAKLRHECRTCEAHQRSRIAKLYHAAVVVLRERFRQRKAKAIAACRAKKIARRGLLDEPIRDLLAKRAAEIATWTENRRHERYGDKQNRRKAKAKSTAKERKQESDDAVVQELPERLIPLWQKVKGKIKGSARMSRAEQFLHFAEEHPHEALAAIEHEVEEEMQRLAKGDEAPPPSGSRWLEKVAGPLTGPSHCVNDRPLSAAEEQAISSDAEAWDFERWAA